MEDKLKNILVLAYTLIKSELTFSETEKRVFKEFMQALKMNTSDFIELTDQKEIDKNLDKLSTKEEKTLLLDILVLLVLSQGNLENEHKVFLFKSMHKIRFQPSDYMIFSLNISFDEFLKRSDLNLDNIYRMLWTKVSHVMRKKIFLPQWSSSLSCDIASVDKQHKSLIDHFVNYAIKLDIDPSGIEVKKMLGFLRGYAGEHFKMEETLMNETECPFTDRHLKEHQEFRLMFADLLDDFKINRSLSTLQKGLSNMLEWFLNHIRNVDVPTYFHLKVKQASSVRKNQLLVYHDSDDAVKPLVDTLTSLGIDRLILSDKEKEAWDWIQTGDIAMVIVMNSDVTFKGIDLLHRIRKNDKKIPVLLMPTVSNQNDLVVSIKKQKLQHSLNQILITPFELDDLIIKLKTALFGT